LFTLNGLVPSRGYYNEFGDAFIDPRLRRLDRVDAVTFERLAFADHTGCF
jgi:hypothetical protein